MVFDGPGAKLPIARLRPSTPHVRRRMLVAEIDRWFAARWAWVRPRTVPLLAAFVGLLVTLGSVKYVVLAGQRQRMVLEQRGRASATLPHIDCDHATERHAPIHFLIEPIGPRDAAIEITLTPIELP